MSLHAQLFPTQFTSNEKLIIINTSELLTDALIELSTVKEFVDDINGIEIWTIPDDLKLIINYVAENDKIFGCYVLANAILKLKLIIKQINSNKSFFGFNETICILNSTDRLENVYKDSLNRYLSN